MASVTSLSAVLSQPIPSITLTKLNSKCFIYDPPASSSTPAQSGTQSPPTTILFLAWMDAAAKHTAKYVNTYAALYPKARIIVAVVTSQDFFMTSSSAHLKALSPVLLALTSDSAASPKLLVHLCSNGGVKTLYMLSTAYRAQTGAALPATLLVLDSAPGRPRFVRDIRVLTMRMPANPVLWLLAYLAVVLAELAGLFVYYCTPFWHKQLKGPREGLLDPKLIAQDRRMCYIYSKEDLVIDDRDVELHAKDAEKKGFRVERHKFVGSAHVSHMRSDEGKYWGAVVDAWGSALKGR